MRSIILAILSVLVCSSALSAENAEVRIPTDQPVLGYALVDAFPGVRFDEPVGIAAPRGERQRLFVVERKGIVAMVESLAAPSRSVFLDLRAVTLSEGFETGLLGLAFHPGYETNGFFYVYRTVKDGEFFNRLSRFRVSQNNPNVADPNSELVIINQRDFNSEHNAGDIHFGPDGYLYLALGDSTPYPEDAPEDGQAIDKGFFGAIIRIDVDKRSGNLQPNPHRAATSNYLVPADNPFVGATSFNGLPVDPQRVRTEFFAVGFRNPWRFTFDAATGRIFAGDVGSGQFEEINIVRSGGNYGWPFREGALEWREAPAGFAAEPPAHAYPHERSADGGTCVIGGIVYRGGPITALDGSYLFADERFGNVWAAKVDGLGESQFEKQWIAAERGVVAFGRDPATGDALLVNISGKLRRLVYRDPAEGRIPEKLSETGLFSDLATLTPARGMLPYSINVPFWSDHAIKKRWFGLTDARKKIGFSEEGNWTFPAGAVWVKHFDLEMIAGDRASARRIETRALVKTEKGVFGFTYRWNEEQTEATLAPERGMYEKFVIVDGGVVREQYWQFPAREQCITCHTDAGGVALAFSTPQLNREDAHGKNQLEMLAELGYLDRPPEDTAKLRRLARATDETQPIEHRVKSYLAANCAQCHQPGTGVWATPWDARITTPLEDARIINEPSQSPFTGAASRVVAPRSVADSMLHARISEPYIYRMPPLGSTVLDDEGRALLAEWILTMPEDAWSKRQLGATALPGSMAQKTDSFVVGGSGIGLENDAFFFSGVAVSNNFQISARLKNVPGRTDGMAAGLMARQRAGAGGSFVAIMEGASGGNAFVTRDANGEAVTPSAGPTGQKMLRLLREGNQVSAWESATGARWTRVGLQAMDLDAELEGGFAVSSGSAWRYATVEFDRFSAVSVALDPPAVERNAPAGVLVPLNARVTSLGLPLGRVEFHANGRLIGSVSQAPWRMQWTNAMAGEHEVRAIAINADGLPVASKPATVRLADAPAVGRPSGSSVVADGIWQGRFGLTGYAAPLLGTNLPAGTEFAVQCAETTGSRAPAPAPGLDDGSGQRVASAWRDPAEIVATFRPPFEAPYQLGLFFADYRREGGSLDVTVRDARTGNEFGRQWVMRTEVGTFVKWTARGAVQVRVRASGGSVTLSGVFIDPLPPAAVTLVSPGANTTHLAGEPVALRAQVSGNGRVVRFVEFYAGETLLSRDSEPPFEVEWRALSGSHMISARVVDEFGAVAASEAVPITVALPAASASFVGSDATTKGRWATRYGGEGYIAPFINERMHPPAQVTMAPGVLAHVWVMGLDDRGLQPLLTDWFTASCWFAAPQGLSFTLELRDGLEHQVALYFLDFDRSRLEHVVEIRNDDGAVMSREVATGLREGVYYKWRMRGRAHVTISTAGVNSVLSGIFIGGKVTGAQLWWAALDGGLFNPTPPWADDADGDGRSNLREYVERTDPKAADEGMPFSYSAQGETLIMEYGLLQRPPDTSVSLEQSEDLRVWRASEATPLSTANGLRFEIPLSKLSSRFYRVSFGLLAE